MAVQKLSAVSETKLAAITMDGGKGKGSAFYAAVLCIGVDYFPYAPVLKYHLASAADIVKGLLSAL